LFFKRRIVVNASSLSLSNAGQYVAALITFPYLVRVLGPEKFGLVTFAQAFVAYLGLIVNFGFDLSGSREVALQRDNWNAVSSTFWNILTAKGILFTLASVAFLILIYVLPFLRREAILYTLSFGVLLGSFLYPTWFFTGIERLWYVGSLNFLIKLGYAMGVFLMVRTPADYLYVPLLSSITQILGGAVGFFLALKYVKRFEKKRLVSGAISQMKRSLPFFLNQGMTRAYSASNTFILGLLTTSEAVGYFSAGERIITAIQAITLMPISGATYPKVANTMMNAPGAVQALLRRVLRFLLVFFGVVSLILFFGSRPAVKVILGDHYLHSIQAMRVLAFVPLFAALGNFYGLQILTNLGYIRTFSIVLAGSLIIDIVLNVLLDPSLGSAGAALSWLVTEGCIAVGSFISTHIVSRNHPVLQAGEVV